MDFDWGFQFFGKRPIRLQPLVIWRETGILTDDFAHGWALIGRGGIRAEYDEQHLQNDSHAGV